MMRSGTRALTLAMAMSVAACSMKMDALPWATDTRLYVGGVPQPEGPVRLGKSYTFNFAERWRFTHVWIEGTGIRPCRYPSNAFRRVPGYPRLAGDVLGPMFERDGKIYSGMALDRKPPEFVFTELRYEVIGEMPNGFERTGYTPFCTQAFSTPNGMALWIVRPDPAKGTDDWIAQAVPVQINGNSWLVKKVPARDLAPIGKIAKPMEYWTLKIPETPYWLHLRFTGSLESVRQYGPEHDFLLNLFHQVVASVRLEPIRPLDAVDMPPFVIWKGNEKPYELRTRDAKR